MKDSLPPPEAALKASVVVPARDEEDLIGHCIEALALQTNVSHEEYEVLLVLDHCTDGTEREAQRTAAEHPSLRLLLLDGPGRGAGHARRTGMEAAYQRLLSIDKPECLIASTDADTIVAPDWLQKQLDAARCGAKAIGGRIELRDPESLPGNVARWRGEQKHQRLSLLADISSDSVTVEHCQFSGASLALTAETYGEIGGMDPRSSLEDEHLEKALLRRGIGIERPLSVRVATSARLVGRARRGLARDLSLASWTDRNSFDARSFDLENLSRKKAAARLSVSAIMLSTSDESHTKETLGNLKSLAQRKILDELFIVGKSRETSGWARELCGPELKPDFGPIEGPGDALWRGLSAAIGDLVLFLDSKSADERHVLGLVGPLLERRDLKMVKGYTRTHDNANTPRQVSELVARPLINLHRPELSGFTDPLSLELAAHRSLLESLSFPVGSSAGIALLLDAAQEVSAGAIAQCMLGSIHSGNQPLQTLIEDAYAVISTFTARLKGANLEDLAPGPLFIPRPDGSRQLRKLSVPTEERPPLYSLREEN